jgi:hypothetical protein
VTSHKQSLQKQILEIRKKTPELERQLQATEDALRVLTEQGRQFELLGQACDALDQLESMGASALFWGKKPEVSDIPGHMARARKLATAHREKLADAEARRKEVKDRLYDEEVRIHFLQDEIAEIEEQEERAKEDFPVYREMREIPFRAMVMPWSRHGEDQRRLRKAMLLALLFFMLFSAFVRIWVIPPRDETEVVQIPEHLLRMAQKTPPPPPKPPEQKNKEEEAKPADTQKARAKAEQSGVLAFKNAFKDLMNDPTIDNLGNSARVRNDGRTTTGQTQRALVTAQAQAGSGGINSASLSRNVSGTGNRMGAVGFSRVQSDVGAAASADRPLSAGVGPSRSDEEIQIVFDRYKAALYRIYNRELRSNPTLRGKIILRITIEPGGEVSACRVESTDLASKTLVAEIVERVRKFNFGPKEGVPKTTILYPIDLLPAG